MKKCKNWIFNTSSIDTGVRFSLTRNKISGLAGFFCTKGNYSEQTTDHYFM
jgi:hypothetical protein